MISFPFILLYVLFHALCMIVRGMDELSARRSSTEPRGAADFLRLLDRMRKNQFQPLYTGLPAHLRPFMRTVRSLYTATCESHGCSERIFYHFLRELILSQQSVHLLCQCTPHQQSFVSLMLAVHYWRDRQIRRYDQWRPLSRSNQEVLAGELIDHLFRQYETPQAVSCIWWRWHEAEIRDFCDGFTRSGYREGVNNALFLLYFAAARGESLHQHDELKFPLSRRVQAFLGKAPAGLRFDQAYWAAIYLAAGGRPENARMVAWAPYSFTHRAFWTDFLRWFAQTESNGFFNIYRQFCRLVEEVALLRFGAGPLADLEAYRPFAGIEPDLNLSGKTPQSLWRRLSELIDLEFPPHPKLRDQYLLYREGDAEIQLVRLRNASELKEEGEAMEHCVGSGEYEFDCLSGDTSIWSLRREQAGRPCERLLTIEVAEDAIREMQGPGDPVTPTFYFELVYRWFDQEMGYGK